MMMMRERVPREGDPAVGYFSGSPSRSSTASTQPADMQVSPASRSTNRSKSKADPTGLTKAEALQRVEGLARAIDEEVRLSHAAAEKLASME